MSPLINQRRSCLSLTIFTSGDFKNGNFCFIESSRSRVGLITSGNIWEFQTSEGSIKTCDLQVTFLLSLSMGCFTSCSSLLLYRLSIFKRNSSCFKWWTKALNVLLNSLCWGLKISLNIRLIPTRQLLRLAVGLNP
jgi:hypothetical protein